MRFTLLAYPFIIAAGCTLYGCGEESAAKAQSAGGADSESHLNDLQVVWDSFHSEAPITAEQLKSCRALHALTKDEFFKVAIPFAMASDQQKRKEGYARMSDDDKRNSAAFRVGTLWQFVGSVVQKAAPPTAAVARGGAVAVDPST